MGASLFTLFFNQNVNRGFWTIAIAHTLFCLSFVALTVKARIRGLDWSLEDAAWSLRAAGREDQAGGQHSGVLRVSHHRS